MLKIGFSGRSNATVVESLRDLIDNSELAPLLVEVRHENFSMLGYLSDFVHMVHKPSSTSEHEVCSLSLFNSFATIFSNFELPEFL